MLEQATFSILKSLKISEAGQAEECLGQVLLLSS